MVCYRDRALVAGRRPILARLRTRRLWLGVLAGGLPAATAAGCRGDVGLVEVAWVVVGRDGEPIFPSGKLIPSAYDDTCNLAARRADGTQVRYALHPVLRICDPACGDCDDPACRVVEDRRLPCDRARFSDPQVPASEDPYLFSLHVRLAWEETVCTPDPPCVTIPGPALRKVQPGLVTDLQVVEIVLDADGGADPGSGASRLDLDGCGCP